jgi:hypothetical protein
MSSKKQNARWWQVYLMVPVLLGLFWPETRAPLTQTEHVIAELGILALIFSAVRWWLRANRSALMSSDARDAGWGVRVYEIPTERLRDMEHTEDRPSEHPVRRIAVSNNQGVLSDTFQRDLPEDAVSVFAYRSTVLRKE